ncbi:MAG: hypothetical protein F6J93_31290 [Oscillatoria sp. SIO1A7]|nr:hypothetical protein [Oscillatoria sp. SIO1A7]
MPNNIFDFCVKYSDELDKITGDASSKSAIRKAIREHMKNLKQAGGAIGVALIHFALQALEGNQEAIVLFQYHRKLALQGVSILKTIKQSKVTHEKHPLWPKFVEIIEKLDDDDDEYGYATDLDTLSSYKDDPVNSLDLLPDIVSKKELKQAALLA